MRDRGPRGRARRVEARLARAAAERLEDPREVGARDEQFHATLVRAAGNDETARVHWDVTERIRIVRRLDFTRADRI
ncbi:MAG TPA: FCD domain-containing protein, partial [Caldimonas sp.]|nr:FCD domain-containing protein [Caldimonas sp.]